MKNSAADMGSKLIDGVSSLLGTPKMNKIEMENKELKGAIQNLHDENKGLKQGFKAYKDKIADEITDLKRDFNKNMEALKNQQTQQKEELINENNGLKRAVSKLFQWFPFARDMFRMEMLCKAVGFTVEQTARLLSGKRLSFSGSLYSDEHKRKYDTENSTAQIAQDSQAKKLHLVVDGKHIGEWFKQKCEDAAKNLVQYRKMTSSKGIKS